MVDCLQDNKAVHGILSQLASPSSESDTFSDISRSGSPESPRYNSPASKASNASSVTEYDIGGRQRSDGLTPSPYYRMRGLPVPFRYRDLAERLDSDPESQDFEESDSRSLDYSTLRGLTGGSHEFDRSRLVDPRGGSCSPSLNKKHKRKASDGVTPIRKAALKKFKVDVDVGDADGAALNWALQVMLQEVHDTLSDLVEARKESNHLLEELIAVSRVPEQILGKSNQYSFVT